MSTRQIDNWYKKGNVWYVLWYSTRNIFFSVLKCRALHFLCRDAEPAENHLKDMLHQLNSIIAAKPSEKAVVCQGESKVVSSHDGSSLVSVIHFLEF